MQTNPSSEQLLRVYSLAPIGWLFLLAEDEIRDSNNLNAMRMSIAAASPMAANLYFRHRRKCKRIPHPNKIVKLFTVRFPRERFTFEDILTDIPESLLLAPVPEHCQQEIQFPTGLGMH